MPRIRLHRHDSTNPSRSLIALICDFPIRQAPRILNLYRCFRNPPEILFVSRSEEISVDSAIMVRHEIVPLPMMGSQKVGLGQLLARSFLTVVYLLYAFVLYARIRAAGDRVNLVHAHYVLPQGLFGLVLSRLLRVPLIVSAVGQDVNVDMRSTVLRGISRFVLSRAFVTIAVSRPLRRLLEHHGIRNCEYLPNSVDTESFCPRDDGSSSRSVIFVGSMIERKRPLCLLRAFEKVTLAVPEARLMMVGSGPLTEVIQREILEKGLGDSVRLYPYVSVASLQELLSRAAVFVLPSQYEGLSLALLEAMSAGKTVVASANESNSDVLHHRTDALLFHSDDVNALADQIILALTDDQLRLKLSGAARALCLREFSDSVIAPKLEEIYMRTLNWDSAYLPKQDRGCSLSAGGSSNENTHSCVIRNDTLTMTGGSFVNGQIIW